MNSGTDAAQNVKIGSRAEKSVSCPNIFSREKS